jgi:hypothetical protein
MMSVLDYILNHCSAKELEVIETAVKKRKSNLGSASLDLNAFAKNLSKTMNDSISQTIAGFQESLKDFAWDLVKKENPDLSDEDTEIIVNQMIPDVLASRKELKVADYIRSGESLVHEGQVNGFPVDAMLEMVFQFISYSNGSLAPEEDRALHNAVKDWPTVFWKAFPEPLQELIRSYLKGMIDSNVFENALTILLSE